MFIHGETALNKAPVLEGILDTVKCKFKTETVAKMIVFGSSNLSTNINPLSTVRRIYTTSIKNFASHRETYIYVMAEFLILPRIT